MLSISVITLFPDLIENYLLHLPYKRGISKKLIEINIVNLKDFAIDKRGTVDDTPYGGGPGMILRPEPIYNAVTSITDKLNSKANVIFLSPRGERFEHKKALEMRAFDNLIIVCGRYEGYDQRVVEALDAKEISIGDFVLSGGEAAALCIMESTIRLIPGVIENSETLNEESFTNNALEYPQYTKPASWMGLNVPEILTGGYHKKIKEWKQEKSKRI